ncbi:MAG: hypothetical protein ACJ79K_15185 [Gemmatimonadaceae bacterium]
MDPDVARLAQVLVIVGAFAGFVVTLAIVARAGLTWTRPRPRPLPEPAAPAIDDARFARLEDAVDSIAIEVERIAEAQRFTAKLMSERIPERLAERATERASDRPNEK